jgi:hypothetical protein
MLSLGFLTKGFVALFPWTFPFLVWFLERKKSFRTIAIDSFGVFLFTVTPLVILILFFPEANISLHKYIDTQVINSIKNVSTVDSRFFILKKLFSELVPVFGLGLVFIVWGMRKQFTVNAIKSNYKSALVFILLGLTGVLPVMISMKQSGFYILATFPFFAIGFGILLIPLINFLTANINYQSKEFKIFKWTAYVFFFTGILLSLYFANFSGRDRNKLKDTYLILSELPSGSIINVNPGMWEDWTLQGYFGRYKNVSLDPDIGNRRLYLMIKNENYSDTLMRDYEMIELETTDYKLFKKK